MMNNAPTSCPPYEVLEALISGHTFSREIVQHVAACERCREHQAAIRANDNLFSRMDARPESPEPALGAPDTEASPPPAPPYRAPEGYRIIEEAHRGTQGVVFRAEHLATRRTVALKILHAGRFATSRQRLRFEREVELLAQLRHPNIVTVHDSGRTPDGGWYVAMEFVEGEPLDRALGASCDTATRQGVADAIRLFARVCAGSAFLHQNGVIHRDLKPANILVDSQGEPRIVDFGLAKATEPDASAPTFTMEGEFAGTLAYAAPEQTIGDPHAVDVRSDVYALGVILYEILARHPPYSTEGSLSEILRRICQVDPQAPSAHNVGGIDRDLDRVLLKALAKDKDERYESAAALRRDLERWLDGLPVEARPASAWYVLRKTVRRHKAPFVLGAVAVVLLAVFAVSMSLAYRRASIEAAKANQIRIFLEDTLASVNPAVPGAEVTVRETLDEAVQWVEIALRDQPEVAASLRLTIGNSYRALGRHDEAEDQITQAIAIRRRLFGEGHTEVARANTTLALVHRDRHNLPEALVLMTAALDTLEAQLGRDNVQLTNAVMNLAGIHMRLGAIDQAKQLYQRALAVREIARGPDHPDTAMCLYRLGELHAAAGQDDLAREHHERALQIRRDALHAEHPDIGRSQDALERLSAP